jgi:hypothetical protein
MRQKVWKERRARLRWRQKALTVRRCAMCQSFHLIRVDYKDICEIVNWLKTV